MLRLVTKLGHACWTIKCAKGFHNSEIASEGYRKCTPLDAFLKNVDRAWGYNVCLSMYLRISTIKGSPVLLLKPIRHITIVSADIDHIRHDHKGLHLL